MAIIELVPDQAKDLASRLHPLEAGRVNISKQGRDIFEVAAAYTRRILWDQIVARIEGGELFARGVPAGQVVAEIIDVLFVGGASPDFAADTLQLGDGFYRGVRIFITSAGLPDPPQKTTAALNWMQANVLRPGQWKREHALEKCRIEAFVTARDALAAWNSLDKELRGKRGAKKS